MDAYSRRRTRLTWMYQAIYKPHLKIAKYLLLIVSIFLLCNFYNSLYYKKVINAKNNNLINSLLNYSYSTNQCNIVNSLTLQYSLINTKLGTMIALADEKYLYMLYFIDSKHFEAKIKNLTFKISKSIQKNVIIIQGITPPIESIALELESYFEGKLKKFHTPVSLTGTSFQQLAWNELIKIPYGSTKSYMSQAENIGRHAAYRAIANANGANNLAIIVPCHRIINNNGKLGGYSSGIERKQCLLDHEYKNR